MTQRQKAALVILAALVATPAWAAAPKESEPPAEQKTLSPEERMARRFPQDVHVSDLVGRPLVDGADSIVGHVRSVIRTPDGKIQLVVPAGGFWGFGQTLIAIPIEGVVSLGTEIFAIDIPADDLRKAPPWSGPADQILPASASLKIAIDRH